MTTSAHSASLAVAPPDSLVGLAVLGKTFFALALVVGMIVAFWWVLRKIGPQRLHGQHLKVVGSTSLGQRERVVIVEVDGTWLVLGVTASQISKLHEMPASIETESAPPLPAGGAFSARFAAALKHHLSQRVAGTPSKEQAQ